VAVKLAVGAPGFAFPLPVAPMAPDPFVPDASTPAKLMTVMEADTLCESVAVTVTLPKGEGANARQISDVPRWPLVLSTNTQVRPPPANVVTVVLGAIELSAATNANSNSLLETVENAGVLIVAAGDRSVETVTSTLIAPEAGMAKINMKINQASDTAQKLRIIFLSPLTLS
jgi:hypothetical protein